MLYLGSSRPPLTSFVRFRPAMETSSFRQIQRVFSLHEAVRALDPAGGRKAVLERLKYAARRGKVKPLARGVYARIPPDMDPSVFEPDPFLVGSAPRLGAVFSHHSSLAGMSPAHLMTEPWPTRSIAAAL